MMGDGLAKKCMNNALKTAKTIKSDQSNEVLNKERVKNCGNLYA